MTLFGPFVAAWEYWGTRDRDFDTRFVRQRQAAETKTPSHSLYPCTAKRVGTMLFQGLYLTIP